MQQALVESEFSLMGISILQVAPLFCGFTDWFGTLNFTSFHPAVGRDTSQVFFLGGGSVAFSTPLDTFWVLFLCRNRHWVVLGVPNPPLSLSQFRYLFCHRHSLVLTQLLQTQQIISKFQNFTWKFSKGRREGIAVKFKIGSSVQSPPKS